MNADSGAKHRILVVDDDPTNTLILSRSLERAGYEVVIAGSGQRALELAKASPFDAILMDMLMPEMDGFQACTQLKQDPDLATIPVLFVTAVSDGAKIIRAFAAGGCDYITKPFRVDEVLARVSVHVRLRRAERELLDRNRHMAELTQELASVNAKLALLSRIDPLTKLLNRRAWTHSVREEERRMRRYGHPYSLVMIDVDHFKKFNDTQGHHAGDTCLRKVARAIVKTCRETDVAGRYGGEEFVILAPNSDLDAGLQLAERLRAAVWEMGISHPASPFGRVSISSGVAASGPWTHEEALRAADAALYSAKSRGRNAVCSAEGELNALSEKDGAAAAPSGSRCPSGPDLTPTCPARN